MYGIGDEVWVAEVLDKYIDVQCPACLGTGHIIILHGADEKRITIKCNFCKQGKVKVYQHTPNIRKIKIDEIRVTNYVGACSRYQYYEKGREWTNVYDTEEEATYKAKDLTENAIQGELDYAARKNENHYTGLSVEVGEFLQKAEKARKERKALIESLLKELNKCL